MIALMNRAHGAAASVGLPLHSKSATALFSCGQGAEPEIPWRREGDVLTGTTMRTAIGCFQWAGEPLAIRC